MNQKHTTSLSIDMVRHIARLARLELSVDEEVVFQKELEKVLTAFNNLSHVPLSAEESDSRSLFACKNALDSQHELTEHISHMVHDIPNNSISTQSFIAQAPESEGVFVRVPMILNQEH